MGCVKNLPSPPQKKKKSKKTLTVKVFKEHVDTEEVKSEEYVLALK